MTVEMRGHRQKPTLDVRLAIAGLALSLAIVIAGLLWSLEAPIQLLYIVAGLFCATGGLYLVVRSLESGEHLDTAGHPRRNRQDPLGADEGPGDKVGRRVVGGERLSTSRSRIARRTSTLETLAAELGVLASSDVYAEVQRTEGGADSFNLAKKAEDLLHSNDRTAPATAPATPAAQ